MIRIGSVLVATVLCVLLTGCMVAPVIPPTGIIYSKTTAPLDVDLKETHLGSVGTSTSHCVLGLVSWGDASTEAAANQGGITTINHADYEFLNIVVGAYQRYRTIVYGQ